MRKPTLIVASVAFVASVILVAGIARADKAFRDEFVVKYVKADSADAKDKAFAEAVDKAKCNLCHVGKSKKDRNAYGDALAKFLSRQNDKEDKAKIQSSLEKVAAMKSASDASAPTFGDLIRAGKLPGGEPDAGKVAP